MCQPGRPSPHGLGHQLSSSSLRAFQSAKSSGDSLPSPGSTRPSSSRFSVRWPERPPYSSKAPTRK